MFRTAMTLGGKQRWLTGFLAVALAVAMAAEFARSDRLGIGVVMLVLATLALCWAMAPCALVVDSSELRVERRAWPALCVPRSSVARVSQLDALGPGTLRLLGVGGFFGSYGLFSNRALGRFRLYATRRGGFVVVRRVGALLPVVLTPDDVDGAMRALAHFGTAA